jgi:hypothetical protein
MEEKQKNILKSFFEIYHNLVIPKKNTVTLNLQSVYNDRIKIKTKNESGVEIEKEIDDETWKLFNGECPSDEFLDAKLNFNSMTDQEFEKPFKKEELTPDFLKKFKEMYENLIEFYNQKYIDLDKDKKTKIIQRTKNEEHNGSVNTVKSTTNGDIDIYLFKGFNYNEDFNESEKKEFEELMIFYDSFWERRNAIYSNIENKLNEKKETEKIFSKSHSRGVYQQNWRLYDKPSAIS